MPSYAAYTSNITTHPRPTVKSPSGAMAVIRSLTAGYWAVTAGVQRSWVQRYDSGGATPTARQDKYNTRSAAPTAPGQSWGTGPAAVGNVLLFTDAGDRIGQLGNRWTPPRPGAEIYMINAEEVGTDDNTTTSATFAHHLTWSEQNPGLEGRTVRGRRPRTRLWHHAAYRGGGNAVLSSRQRRHWGCFETRRWAKYFMPDFDALLLAGGGTTTPLALLANVTLAASVSKAVGKGVAATVTASAAVAKGVSKALSAPVTATASVRKTVSKALSSSVAITATMTRSITYARALVATVASSAAFAKLVNKPLQATITSTASVQRVANKILSAPVTATASVTKLVAKGLSAAVSITATIGRTFIPAGGNVFPQALTASVAVTASVKKLVSKPFSAAVAITATLSAPLWRTRATDTFTRTVGSGSWGTSDSGHAWTIPAADAALSVDGAQAVAGPYAPGGISQPVTLDVGLRDLEVTAILSFDPIAVGNLNRHNFYFRHTGGTSTTYIWFAIEDNSNANIRAWLVDSAGVGVGSGDILTGLTNGRKVRVRMQLIKNTAAIKLWYDGNAEPAAWSLTHTLATDTTTGDKMTWKNGHASTNTVTWFLDDLVVKGVLGAVIGQALSAAIAAAASVRRTVNKSLVAPVASSATVTRLVSKALVANATLSASVRKTVSKTLSTGVALTAALTKNFPKTLSAAVTTTASVRRTVNKLMSAPVTASSTIKRVIGHAMSAPVVASASIQKVTTRTLSAAVAVTASIGRTVVHLYQKSLVATVTVAAAIGHIFHRGLLLLPAGAARVLSLLEAVKRFP